MYTFINKQMSLPAIPVFIISSYGLTFSSNLTFELSANSDSHKKGGTESVSLENAVVSRLQWRDKPALGCEVQYVKAVSKFFANTSPVGEICEQTAEDKVSLALLRLSRHSCTVIRFADFDLNIVIESEIIEASVHRLLLNSLHAAKSSTFSTSMSDVSSYSSQLLFSSQLSQAECQLQLQQEQSLQLRACLRCSEGCLRLDKLLATSCFKDRRSFFDRWAAAVKEINRARMNTDR